MFPMNMYVRCCHFSIRMHTKNVLLISFSFPVHVEFVTKKDGRKNLIQINVRLTHLPMPDMLCAWHFFPTSSSSSWYYYCVSVLPCGAVFVLLIIDSAANGRWIGNVCSNVACRLAFVWNFLRRRRSAKNGFRSVPFETKTIGEANPIPMTFRLSGAFTRAPIACECTALAVCVIVFPDEIEKKYVCLRNLMIYWHRCCLANERINPTELKMVLPFLHICAMQNRETKRKTTSTSRPTALSLTLSVFVFLSDNFESDSRIFIGDCCNSVHRGALAPSFEFLIIKSGTGEK